MVAALVDAFRTPAYPRSMVEGQRVYLDHAATTPLDARVLDAMLPYLRDVWGNPSSIYLEGREARKALDAARRTVAECLGARPNDIVFTSGGSESDNAAIRGAAFASLRRGRHVVTSAIEHHAVLHTVEQLEREGFSATYLPVDGEGFVDPQALRRALRPDPTVVSIMYANNEVGTVEPIATSSSTRTPCRPSAPSTSTSTAWASTCSRSRRTRSTGRRASARSTSGRARLSSARSSAARRNATAAPARRMSPAPSAWRRGRRWRVRGRGGGAATSHTS